MSSSSSSSSKKPKSDNSSSNNNSNSSSNNNSNSNSNYTDERRKTRPLTSSSSSSIYDDNNSSSSSSRGNNNSNSSSSSSSSRGNNNSNSSSSSSRGNSSSSSSMMDSNSDELWAQWEKIQEEPNPYIPLDLMQSTFSKLTEVDGSGDMELKDGVESVMSDNVGYQAALRAIKIMISYTNKPKTETTTTFPNLSRTGTVANLSSSAVSGAEIPSTDMNSLIVRDTRNPDILAATANNCLDRLRVIDNDIARINQVMMSTLSSGASSSAMDISSKKEERLDLQIKRQLIETLLDITRSIQADNLRRENQDRTSRISLRAQQTATINRTLADSKMLELQLRIGTLATYYSEDEFTHVVDSIMNGLNAAEKNIYTKQQILAWFRDAKIILVSIAEENARTVAGTYAGIGALSGLTGLRIPVLNGSSQMMQRLAEVGLSQGPLTNPSLVYKALAFGQQILTSIGNAATFPARLIARAFAYTPNTCVFVGGAGAIWHIALTEDDRTVLRDIASRAGNTVRQGANAFYDINSEFRDYLIERGLNVTDEDMADLISRASSSRGSVTDDTIAASISGNTTASQSIAASIASSSNSKASRIVTDLQAAAGDQDRFIDILQKSERELGQQGAIDTNLDAEVESKVQGQGSLVGSDVDASNAISGSQMSELSQSQSQSWSRTGSPAYDAVNTNSRGNSRGNSQNDSDSEEEIEVGMSSSSSARNNSGMDAPEKMAVGMSSSSSARNNSGMAAPEEMANLLTGDEMNEENKGGRRKSRRRIGKLQTKKRQYRLRRRKTYKKKHMRRRTLKRRRPLRQAKRRSLKKQRRLRRRQTRR